jgi:hypothetical protein
MAPRFTVASPHVFNLAVLQATARSRPFLLASSILLFILLPNGALAGKYELVKGKGVEVCEAYNKNLNSFRDLPHPLSCERKINPDISGFEKPQWKFVNGLENIKLVNQIDALLNPARPSGEEIRLRELKKAVEQHGILLEQADVDINNDGASEAIVKYQAGGCQMGNYYGTPLIALDNERMVDMDKTDNLIQNVGRSEKYIFGRWEYAMYDVFVYKGKTYFDKWSDDVDKTNIIRAFKTDNDRTAEVCVYQYVK